MWVVNANKTDKLNWLMIVFEWQNEATTNNGPCKHSAQPKYFAFNYFYILNRRDECPFLCAQRFGCVCEMYVRLCTWNWMPFSHIIRKIILTFYAMEKRSSAKSKRQSHPRSLPPLAHLSDFRVQRNKVEVTFRLRVSTTHLPIYLIRWLNR